MRIGNFITAGRRALAALPGPDRAQPPGLGRDMNERDGDVSDRAHALAAPKAVRTSGLCAVFLLGLLAASTAHADGPVVGWGQDNYGQASPPASVGGPRAPAIAAGGSHSCAIQAGTGNVVCWGVDFYGEASPPASPRDGPLKCLSAGKRRDVF